MRNEIDNTIQSIGGPPLGNLLGELSIVDLKVPIFEWRPSAACTSGGKNGSSRC